MYVLAEYFLWALSMKDDKDLDYRESEELSWCPSWSNSLWQGCSCGLEHCPGGNATDPIWRVLASSDGIPSLTPLKPQNSNPNPNPLANQVWCIGFLTLPTPLIIPHWLPAWYSIHARYSVLSAFTWRPISPAACYRLCFWVGVFVRSAILSA